MGYKQRYSLLKIIPFILGIIYIVISLGTFLSGDYFYAFLDFSIGLLLFYPAFNERVNFVTFIKRFFSYYLIIFIVFLIFTNFNKASLYAFLTSIILASISHITENKYGKKLAKEYMPIQTIQEKPEKSKSKFQEDTNDNGTKKLIGDLEVINVAKESKKIKEEILYAKQKVKRLYQNKSKVKSESKDKEEIKAFFASLQKKRKIPLSEYKQGIILSDANFNLFYSFLNSTNKSLKILCWRIDEKLLSELLWFLKDKDISVEIIAKNRTNPGYLNEFKKYCSKLEINSKHRTKIHAKLIVKDGTSLIGGSSNFTEASMSETGYFLDCNIITNHKPTIQSAIDLFNSIYDNKDYTKGIKDSKLMYSRNDKDYLPLSLKPYFEQEKEEIILLFSCKQVDKRIVERIIGWNPSTQIKLYVSDYWSTSEISNENLVSMKWLYETFINVYKNVTVIPIKSNVHSKLYLFNGQGIAFVSSQNLTVSSWQSLLETGVTTDNKSDFEYLMSLIKSFKKSQLSKIESTDWEETNKPEDTFSGSEYERSIGLPWELPEANSEWKIQKTRNIVYFKLVKGRPSENKSELSQFQGSRDKTKEIIKSPLLQELESRHLYKQATTDLRSSPTRYTLTGKLSKRKIIRGMEAELAHFKKRYELESDGEKKKKLEEAIKYREKELEKYY